MKKLITTLLTLSFILSSNGENLHEVLAHTYSTNAKLNAAREELKATDERIMQALSRWLPRITAERSKQYVDQKRFEGNQVPRTGDGTVDSLNISQNLFRGGSDIASMKAAQYTIEQMRATLISREQEALLTAIEAYMKVLQSQEAYLMSQEREKHSQVYLAAITKRFQVGQTTKTDVAQAEASYSAAIAARVKAYSDYKNISASFQKITNLEPKNLSIPQDNLNLPKALDEVTNISLRKNPGLIAAKSRYEANNSAIGTKLAGILPSLDFQYSITNNSKARDLVPVETTPKLSKTTVISLKIPLFDGGNNWSELRQSKRAAKQAGYELNNTRNETIEKAVQTWQEANAAKAVYHSRQGEVRAARVAYDGVLAEERAGLRDVTDVISIRNKYFDAVNQLLISRSEYYVKLYSLKAQIGECTAQDLGLKVTLYDPFKNYKNIRWQLIGAYTGD